MSDLARSVSKSTVTRLSNARNKKLVDKNRFMMSCVLGWRVFEGLFTVPCRVFVA